MPRRSVSPLRSLSKVFAALGDETRLGVLSELAKGEPQSIARLTTGTRLTRQAVTKHLRVLERAGVVCSLRNGREHHFALRSEAVEETRQFLASISSQWDHALARLRSFVEESQVAADAGAAGKRSWRRTPSV